LGKIKQAFKAEKEDLSEAEKTKRELESIAVSNISIQQYSNKSNRKYNYNLESATRAFSGPKPVTKEVRVEEEK
jgi:hypothetical protein